MPVNKARIGKVALKRISFVGVFREAISFKFLYEYIIIESGLKNKF